MLDDYAWVFVLIKVLISYVLSGLSLIKPSAPELPPDDGGFNDVTQNQVQVLYSLVRVNTSIVPQVHKHFLITKDDTKNCFHYIFKCDNHETMHMNVKILYAPCVALFLMC